MNMRFWLVLIVVSSLCSACGPATTPPPAGTLGSVPLSTTQITAPTLATGSQSTEPAANLPLLPAKVGDNYAPPSVPACPGIQSLAQPFNLPWQIWDPAKEDRVIKHALENNWTFYHCAQSVTALSAFYHQWMPTPPYNWFEDSIEDHSEGTLAIYNNSKVSTVAGYRWVYLAFIPDPSNSQSSKMGVVWWDAPYTC